MREEVPPGKFQVTRKRNGKLAPMALPPEERVVWNAVDFSTDPYRVFRKACLTWYEGLKALWGLWDRGLVGISKMAEEVLGRGRSLREGGGRGARARRGANTTT